MGDQLGLGKIPGCAQVLFEDHEKTPGPDTPGFIARAVKLALLR